MQNVTPTLSRIGIAFVLMLLTPLTFSSSSSSESTTLMTENAACAAKEDIPACVPEVDAICTYKGTSTYDHYLDD